MVAGSRGVNYASRLIARLWRAFSVVCGQSYPASHLACCGAFLWLCRGLASTLMLMGGGVNYMPSIIMPIFENIGFSCLTICCTNTLSSFQNDSFGSV